MSLTYHYLQKSLRQKNKPLFRKVVAGALTRLGIWFPPSAYSVLPIALPFAVRDAGCRRPIDEWSSPNEAGYVRDDNSLIKGLTQSFTISSDLDEYSGRRRGSGFVAAHVWSRVGDTYSTRNPATYSFLPNLVWLPSTLAKLTDIDQSFAQRFVQAMSYKMYHDVEIHEKLRPFVAHSWSLLPVPEFPKQRLPDINALSVFRVPQSFLYTRVDRIRTASRALLRVAAGDGESIKGKVLHKRYTAGLTALPPVVSAGAAKRLGDHLGNYADCVEAAIRTE